MHTPSTPHALYCRGLHTCTHVVYDASIKLFSNLSSNTMRVLMSAAIIILSMHDACLVQNDLILMTDTAITT